MSEHTMHDWVLMDTTEISRRFYCTGCDQLYEQYARVRWVPGKGDELYFPPMPGDR